MPLRYFVTLWKRRITFSSPGNSWGRCTPPWQVRIGIRWDLKNLKQKCFFSLLMSFLLDYWVEPWGAMAESTSYHPGLDLITSFLKWIQIWWKFSIQLRSRFEPTFPPPCFPHTYNTSWVGVWGPHYRLDFHQQPGRPLPGPKTYHDADQTVVITNGSTNSQKLPICKLDKEQILARIEMKTEIWVPFLLQSQPHNETERGGSVGLLPLWLHLSWAVLLHART